MLPFYLQIILLLLVSTIVGYLVTHIIDIIWKKTGLLDRPHLYKTERGRAPAPYGIGVSIMMTLLLTILIFPYIFDVPASLEHKLHIVLILGSILTLVSFVDDLDTIGKSRISIPPIVRLLMQIGIGVIIGITSIKISYISGGFGEIVWLDQYFFRFLLGEQVVTIYYIPLLITTLWYVLVFNSVNFSDGIPGLTGGFSLISFIILGFLAIKLYLTDTTLASQENSQFILIILAVLIPITLLVTRLDIKRLGIMGDSGTIILGFFIATLSIIAGGKIATAMSVLGIYLIDFIYVIGVRLLSGQNPMKGDQTHHLHYRLLELGLSQSTIRNIIYFLAGFFGVTAIFLDTTGKIALFIIIAFVTFFLTKILSIIKK